MTENELMNVENQSVKDFLISFKELESRKNSLSETELTLYNNQRKMLADIGNSLEDVKNTAIVLSDNNCYSAVCKDAREYAEFVYTLTDGFNKDFMNTVKDAQIKENSSLTVTAVSRQEHKELINAPLQLNDIKRELKAIDSLNKELTIDDITKCAEKVSFRMEALGLDGKDINSVFKATYEDGQNEVKKILTPIAKLEIEMPKPKALYEIHYPDKDGKDSFLLVNETNLAKTSAFVMIKNELDVHIVNIDTKEEFNLSSKDFEEHLVAKLDSKENFEKIKDSAPVITTNNINEVGSVRNGQAVVLETAHGLGELEREAAGTSGETITNEMLRFEEKIGRKITDVELVNETVEELIREVRFDNKIYYENTIDVDDIGNGKFNHEDIDF